MHRVPNLLHPEEHFPQYTRPKKRAVFLFYLVVVLCALFLATRLFPDRLPNDPSAFDPSTLEPIAPKGLFKKLKYFVFQQGTLLAGANDDRVNILLLGMGGIGHDGPFLTDTMMIVSVKPSTRQVAMISIPRDLAVDMPGYGVRKINYANALGETKTPPNGLGVAEKVVENTFDMEIHYVVRVDFTAFEEAIDSLGGIEVDVEQSFTDTQFPAENTEYQTISFAKGMQTMKGARALQFARSRHGNNGEGSDFARARRQQKMLMALKQKILSPATLFNPIEIHALLNTLEKHMTTNMEFGDMMSLLKFARDFDRGRLITVVLDTEKDGYLENASDPDMGFFLRPKDGNFDSIQTLISRIFDPNTLANISVQDEPLIKKNTPAYPGKIEIQNGTWEAGLAARVKKQFEESEFIVVDIGNTPIRPIEKSGVFLIRPKTALLEKTINALQATFHVPIQQSSLDVFVSSTADILVILGNDFDENYDNTNNP